MKAIKYESQVRRAFSYSAGKRVDRWGDPAGLADTDQFRAGNLASVKIGAGYAFRILISGVRNHIETLPEEESKRLLGFLDMIIAAEDLDAVSAIIEEFTKTVEEQYFRSDDGVLVLK